MPSISTYVEVDLSEFDDDEIREEFNDRFGHDGVVELREIFQLMRTGHRERAHDLMWDYLRDKLGRVA